MDHLNSDSNSSLSPPPPNTHKYVQNIFSLSLFSFIDYPLSQIYADIYFKLIFYFTY